MYIVHVHVLLLLFLISPSLSFSRVVWAVSIWVSMAKAEVVKDPTFQKLLQYLQKSLAKDGLEEDQRNLNMCLMDTIKRSSYHEGTKGGGSSGLSIPVREGRAPYDDYYYYYCYYYYYFCF